MTALRLLFPLATIGAAGILAAIAARDIPRITGTVAAIAALGAAILR
ncbi:hypothetical protein [Streptomyces sp. MCL20-2]|nr:hypothetical protein [Streptomyces sp. MCL20-2]